MEEFMTSTSSKKNKYSVIGTSPIRHDALGRVTGKAKYGVDLRLTGMLFGKTLRSPHAHARIIKIDTSKAEAHPGVRAVITTKDMPIVKDEVADFGETMANYRLLAELCLANDKVLYKGHAVAVVAADNIHIAEEALSLIEVEYEVLPSVLTVQESMKEGAPLLHEQLTTRAVAARFTRGTDTGVQSNVASRILIEGGDVEAAFATSDVVVEREFNTKMVHQGYIEPHNETAFWAPDGHLTIWTSTQGAFGVRTQISKTLGLSESHVKVVPMEVGGGFGGKIRSYMGPTAALLSKKTGRPVKIVMNRKEVFESSGPTSGSNMRAKIGATKDGKITAAQVYLAYEAGAYPGSPVGAGASTCLSPYNLQNFSIEGLDVVVNKPQVSAYRAPGSPAAALAVETVIDEVAEKLGMDPIDFRLKNATKEGDRQVSGVVFPRIGCVEVEEAIKNSDHYNSPLEGKNKGRGTAMGWWFNGGNASTAMVTVNSDGTVGLVTGSVDLAGTRTALSMQVAEVLGITPEEIYPSVGDTDSIGWTGPSGGSRTTFSTGIAAIQATNIIIDEMKKRAALLWETQPEDISFVNSTFISSKNSNDKFSFKELAGKLMGTGGPLSASSTSNPTQVGSAFGGHICDVEVDTDTGKVTVLRYTALQDVGQAAHKAYCESQVQGGAVQGIGWALNEEYYYTNDGTMANSTFLDYRMPTALDLPMIDTILVEVPSPGHPFGIRGVGEVPIVPPLAAVANAIADAIGVRLTELPMNPASILAALKNKK
jgi:xanthine dehydrogenase molybdenum-binding subunit